MGLDAGFASERHRHIGFQTDGKVWLGFQKGQCRVLRANRVNCYNKCTLKEGELIHSGPTPSN